MKLITFIPTNASVVVMSMVLVLAALLPLQGQIQTATLSGVVTDKLGAVVPNAHVQLVSLATGSVVNTTSGSAGVYTITNLPPAHYKLIITHSGFDTLVVSDLVLQVGQKATENVTLEVGAPTQRVVVSAAVPLLQTTSSTVSEVVAPVLVSSIPLNGRQFWQLVEASPGVRYTPAGGNIVHTGGTSIRAESVNITVNGVGPTWTGWYLDGGNITEMELGGTLIQPNVDALQEFQTESADMSAEYGHAPSAVNAVLKSGTNQFHGDAFDYLRNNATDARNFFSSSVLPLKRNQFGGTFGGPIKHDRIFFFSDYQGTRIRQGEAEDSAVPDLAMRHGDFGSTTILNPATYTPCPGNIIPSSMISSPANYLLKYMPPPNAMIGTTPYFDYSPTVLLDQDEGDIKVDALVTEKDHVMDRYSIGDNRENDPSGYPLEGLESLHSRAQNETLQWSHVFSPQWLNVAQFSYYRDIFVFGGLLEGTPVDTDAGIQGLSPALIGSSVGGFPEIEIAGYYGFYGTPDDQRPKSNRIRDWDYNDAVSTIRGVHNLKYGFEWMHRTDGFFNGAEDTGIFDFEGTYSGNGFADYLLGFPENATRSAFRDYYGESGDFPALWFQDDARVKRNLTLNLGVRWEDNSFFNGERGEISAFDPSTGHVVIPSDALTSTNITAQAPEAQLYSAFKDEIDTTSELGLPESIRPAEARDWGPRIGFAWNPRSGKTVFRGAYGLFYGFGDTNNIGNEVGTVPFLVEQTLYSVTPPVSPTLAFANFFGSTPLDQVATPDVTTAPLSLHQMYTSEWNFSVQRELASRISLTVGYVANSSMHLQTQESTNDPLPGPGSIQDRRPFPQWGTTSEDSFDGHGIYNALQTSLQFRDWHNLTLIGSYAYSKCMDNGTDESGPPTESLIPAYWAVCDIDQTNTGSISYSYALPVGTGRRFLAASGIANRILGNWSISGVTTLQSGLPFSPEISKDVANTGVSPQWPNRVATPLVLGNVSCWFYISANPACDALAPNATNAFVLPAEYTYGNGGRNTLRGDSLSQFDVALEKNVRLTESKTLQFRAEAFNLFNTPAFSAPSLDINTSSGAEVSSTENTERIFEFALKLYF
jgi:Carboxypeptidase regulatory-like domain